MTQEIDATAFLDVVIPIGLGPGSGEVRVPKHSHILGATVDPRYGPTLWVKGPIDAGEPNDSWPLVKVYVIGEGDPAPKYNAAYLSTLTMLEPPSLIAPGAKPKVRVVHVFADMADAVEGEVALGKL